jgi:hypothetical protein
MSKKKKKEPKWFSLSDIGESLNTIGDALEKHVEATKGLSKEEIKRKAEEQWQEEFFRRLTAQRVKKNAPS